MNLLWREDGCFAQVYYIREKGGRKTTLYRGGIEMNKLNEDIFENTRTTLPLMALRGLVAFPNTVIHFDVQRDKSRVALEKAMKGGQELFLVAQRDLRIEDPEAADLYTVGVIARVRQTLKVAPNVVRILVEGVGRGRLIELRHKKEYSEAEIEMVSLDAISSETERETAEALVRIVKELFDEYVYLSPTMPKELILNVMAAEDPIYLVEYIASNLMLPLADKQALLEEDNPIQRLTMLSGVMEKENRILMIENELNEKVRESMDRNQRDYYLREQMRVISQELGDDVHSELATFNDKLAELAKREVDEVVLKKLSEEIDKLGKLPTGSQEAAVIRQFLDTCFALPFGVYTKDKLNIQATERLLNKEHYGLKKVKERILELLAVRQLAPDIKGQIICLVGPPGVGKTSIAKSIATSMGRNYARLSLGGVKDESDIRGHRKTYVGAMPGRIIGALKQAQSSNPLILLDEVDKLGNDFRGDPASALLEVLDPEQNRAFVDHYVEVPFDLSKVLFITTANSMSSIPAPLLDRMEVIDLSSYTREEKFQIAKRHLVPKQLKQHGLSAKVCRITDTAIYGLIDFYTREAGVRKLERSIASLCRKAAKRIIAGECQTVSIKGKDLEIFLGSRRFRPEKIKSRNEIGVVNGLAWTSVGGELMPIEVNILGGTGKIEMTGSLGQVIKESALIAISYVRSKAVEYGIDPEFYKKCDIHIHAPEGAVPKDGPSAGVTMVTALVSALNNYPVRYNVAMTGEVTLRGRVLPIGGLREKSMAAYRAGVSTVLIPEDNMGDLEDVDDIVKEHVCFVPADRMDTVLKTALLDFPKKSYEVKRGEIEVPVTLPVEKGGLGRIQQ